jgi:hypothetical protein
MDAEAFVEPAEQMGAEDSVAPVITVSMRRASPAATAVGSLLTS